MEQIRSNRFKWAIQTAPEINPEEIFMPPMLIQPLLENAIWHGGGSFERILNIRISFSRKDDQVVCIVEDDGIGLNASLQQKQGSPGHHSLGIANIRQRIQVLNEKHNLRSTISIEDRSAHSITGEMGTRATLRLPIKYSEI
jgi:sensor histidine kinase YesM